MYVDEIARSNSPLRSFRVRHTGIGCLDDRLAHKPIRKKKTVRIAYFFASNHLSPSSPGSSDTTLSSARNIPFSLSSILRASNGLNLPLNFVTPTTREIN